VFLFILNKLFIEKILSVEEFFERFLSRSEAVKQNGDALQFISDQTEKICLEAVKQNGYALRFVIEQNDKICLEALRQDRDTLQFVKNLNLKIRFQNNY
jgi:hypothetical protein